MTSGVLPDESRELLTRAQAAERLGLSTRTLDRLVAARLVRYVKLGSGRRSPIRFHAADLDEYLERRAVAPRVHTGLDRQRLLRLAERAEDAARELRAALLEVADAG